LLAAFTFVGISVAWLGDVIKNAQPIYSLYDKYTYIHTLQAPFETVIDQKTIDGMSSGEAELALLRIDGYLGHLKDEKIWKKLCVLEGAKRISKTPSNFLNLKYPLEESRTDKLNRTALQSRIDYIELTRVENGDIERKPDVFKRLLARSSRQLLYLYKAREIDQLDKPQLYLLRNAIYGKHGYVFSTPKLQKFANRQGWNAVTTGSGAYSVVEVCNAFFLEELYASRELGAIGRGILFLQGPEVPAAVKAQVCACLGQRRYGIDCHDNDGSTLGTQFYKYVDLVIDIREGDKAEVRWSYLDQIAVADADLPQFELNDGRFRAAALQFSALLQGALEPAGARLEFSADEGREAYWGVTIRLPAQQLARLRTDPKLTFDVSNSICVATFDAIDQTGPYLPLTIGTEPEVVDNGALLLFSKPIVLDDERRMLTREYVARAYPASNANIDLRPRALVLQATSSENLDEVFDQMLPAARKDDLRQLNPATHYLIGPHGKVYRLMNDAIVARHAPGLDMSAIGITLVGAVGDPPARSR
jgi:YARHG domain/N-acetylmuramoyl-L-alanine amidase